MSQNIDSIPNVMDMTLSAQDFDKSIQRTERNTVIFKIPSLMKISAM